MNKNVALASRVSRMVLMATLALCVANSLEGADYQWDFNGNLNASFGSGILSYADASSQTLTVFGTTDGSTVPHINGQPATFMHVPAFTAVEEGYSAEFVNTGPNGGGSYVNQYTMIFDFQSPGDLAWTPFFNTSYENANDADFYLAGDGAIGIGADYSAIGLIQPNMWYRVAFTADLGSGIFTYYIDGTQVYQRTGGSLLDLRHSLYSNADPGPDIRLFNEGDLSGDYTHEVYLSSFFFSDRELSATEIAALGGPDADGISTGSLTGDYNGNGVVDAADYVIWRKNGGTQSEYDDWRTNFGPPVGSGSGLGAGSSVPEPAMLGALALAFSASLLATRRR
ncbi:MAG: hypothetical protein IT425_01610 [Pirellulales bacterium]|nr:hypothetical protein [Pirellulales bacterium]